MVLNGAFHIFNVRGFCIHNFFPRCHTSLPEGQVGSSGLSRVALCLIMTSILLQGLHSMHIKRKWVPRSKGFWQPVKCQGPLLWARVPFNSHFHPVNENAGKHMGIETSFVLLFFCYHFPFHFAATGFFSTTALYLQLVEREEKKEKR